LCLHYETCLPSVERDRCASGCFLVRHTRSERIPRGSIWREPDPAWSLLISFSWQLRRFSYWYLHSQIELKAEDLYDKEKVDLERVELGDVFKLLQATEEGLTSEQCAERLTIFGPNKLESEEQNPFLQVCGLLWNQIPNW
jgi:hypothetical protein